MGIFHWNLAPILMLKLASLNLVPPDVIPKGNYQIADLLLFHLNQREQWDGYMGMDIENYHGHLENKKIK